MRAVLHLLDNCSKLYFLKSAFIQYTQCFRFYSIDITKLFKSVCDGDRSALARAITLIESQNPYKKQLAQNLLNMALKKSTEKFKSDGWKLNSFRIGLTGPPGSGKSTFIEAFGKFLTSKGHKVAVLAIDPSSSTTGGSLLGDKTRMPELSRDMNAFIRPSPSSGYLGGVTRNTSETIVLCESAGYDIVIVETIGVGQAEYHVSYMVDLCAMIVSPGGGDELQALKKGIVELMDIIIINKADGDLLPSAQIMRSDYLSALKFVKRRFKSWKPPVLCVSSKTKNGIDKLWDEINNFKSTMSESEQLFINRKLQYSKWMWLHIENNLLMLFKNHPKIQHLLNDIEKQVENCVITPGQASDLLLNEFLTFTK